jgi:hypothetical protein
MADRVAPPPPGLTHYDVLGIDRFASAAEIKNAYRVCSNRWHEAKHIGPGAAVAAQWMKLVNAAKATLYDPESKARYDDILVKTGWYDLSTAERERHESPESLHVWRRAERQAAAAREEAERARQRHETAERRRQEERARELAEWWAAREERFWSDTDPLIARGAKVEFGRMITLLQNELQHRGLTAPPEFWDKVKQALGTAKAVHDAQHAQSHETPRDARPAYEHAPEQYASPATDHRIPLQWWARWDVVAGLSGALVVAIAVFAPLVPTVAHTLALNLSMIGLAVLGVFAGHRTLGLRPWRVPRHARRSAYVGLAAGYLVLWSVGLTAYTRLRDGGLLGGHVTTTRDELRMQLQLLSDAMVRSRNVTGRWPSRIPASYQAPLSVRMRIEADPAGGWRGEAEHWTGTVCVIAVKPVSRTTASERIACRDNPAPR